MSDVLLTGATGHVGGRLLAVLERDGIAVRCLARSPQKLEGRTAPATEVVAGDVQDLDSLAAALWGCRAAYFLVHSLVSGSSFEEEEARGAEAFARAAREAGVGRIVYLGGLARGNDLSPHMRSRQEVGRILRESGVPTIELRASIVLGHGSLSFEMIRTLVDTAPALVLPDWVDTACQPIAVDDVVAYLRAALDVALDGSVVVEIGGADRTTYRRLIEAVADARGTATPTLALPTPPLPFASSDVPGLDRLLPEAARAPLKLIESLRYDSSVTDDSAERLFPAVRPAGVDAAVAAALQ